MARYILVPKQDIAVSLLNFADICFSETARRKQVKQLKKLRKEVEQRTHQAKFMAESAKSLKVKKLASPTQETQITGVTILEAPPGSLNTLRAYFLEYDVMEDLEVTLIPPTRTKAHVKKAAEVDTWHLEAVQLLRARRSGFKGTGKGVGVAILDTGIQEVREIRGRVKASFRVNGETGQIEEVPPQDTDGHGTHVAGLVAGSTVGIAPYADLMNFIMIPGGFGKLSDFVLAIEFVATQPEISIMNMSAGIPGFHEGMKGSLRALLGVGVLPVIAIGNEGANTSRSPGNYSEALSVGASTKQDKVASFSGGGTMVVHNQSYIIPDLVAPGQAVTSCVMDGGYESWNGTSMATPLVSGIATLIIEANPLISEPDLRAELHENARSFLNVPPQRQGGGLCQLPQRLWFTGA